jgi:hypothetical protein
MPCLAQAAAGKSLIIKGARFRSPHDHSLPKNPGPAACPAHASQNQRRSLLADTPLQTAGHLARRLARSSRSAEIS